MKNLFISTLFIFGISGNHKVPPTTPNNQVLMRNSREIKTLVSDYERNLSSGQPFYMDASDLIDIMDYYMNRHADYAAETCLRIAKRLHPSHPEVIITQAYRLKEQGQWEAARQLVSTISDQTSSDVLLFNFEYYRIGAQGVSVVALGKKARENVKGMNELEHFSVTNFTFPSQESQRKEKVLGQENLQSSFALYDNQEIFFPQGVNYQRNKTKFWRY